MEITKYKFFVSDLKKIVHIQTFGFWFKEDAYQFFDEFEEYNRRFCGKGYMVIMDPIGLKSENQDIFPEMEHSLVLLAESGFSQKYVLLPEQHMTAWIQCNRILQQAVEKYDSLKCLNVVKRHEITNILLA
ncbi:hypothetical protein [Vallitalea okinawensis]|uniref:hypothetical protein n=1 Tax=Vallitalea okinawensis TaxID=2078660 RepID=UPI000CFC8408|nr:hypothetical protein [Vallitalea okinawensis]